MNILITGGTGFVGRNLTRQLASDGYRVFILSRKDTFLETFRSVGCVVLTGDILDRNTVEAAVSATRPDIVVHMAALTPVRESWRSPREFMEVNYLGTINVAEAVKSSGRGATLIHYSTPEVLKPVDSLVELGEDAEAYPTSPYAASKLAAEAYVRYSGVDHVVLRPANTYDRSAAAQVEESRGYFVEKAIIGVLTSDRVDFDGSPQSVRTWMHVSDHVSAVKTIVDRADKYVGRVVHIAPPDSTASCLHIYTTIVEEAMKMGLIDRPPYSTWMNRPRPYDPQYLAVKGSNIPGWSPMSLREGLVKAIRNWAEALGVAPEI
jgi:nucleoside-diphosphate-sugar epimerase